MCNRPYFSAMRRIIIPLLLWPLLTWAQPMPKALLWKISGNGLEKPSYLVGTVHSRDARAYAQVGRLLEIIGEQDVVAGELDLSSNRDLNLQLVQIMMMPPDTQLADLLPKRKLKRVRKVVAEQLGPMAMMMDRVKPFFLMGMMTEVTIDADSTQVLDQYLAEQAKAMGKEVVGVETIEEQMAVVELLTLKQQADMLYEASRTRSHRKELDQLMEAYARQDLEALYRLSQDKDLPVNIRESLLTSRNEVMASRMDGLMRDGRTFLFALGAMHLPGNDGVITLLRAMGYTVEPDAGGH